jgi:hypothetical protein
MAKDRMKKQSFTIQNLAVPLKMALMASATAVKRSVPVRLAMSIALAPALLISMSFAQKCLAPPDALSHPSATTADGSAAAANVSTGAAETQLPGSSNTDLGGERTAIARLDPTSVAA